MTLIESRRGWYSFVFCILCGLSGCADSTGPAGVAGVTSMVVDSTAGPLDRVLEVEFAAAAAIQVTYWRDGDGQALRLTGDSAAIRHELYLPRLRADAEYIVEARSVGAGGGLGEPRRLRFSTGTLPEAVASLAFHATGMPTEPLLLIEVMATTTGFGGVVILDEDGQVVWYWQGRGGFLMGGTRRANGHWVFQDAGRLVEVSNDRRIVRELPVATSSTPYGEIHHDVIATPSNTLYFIARETRPSSDGMLVGEAIWEWGPETDLLVKRWSAFDFLQWPADRGPDSELNNWLHMNALSIGARGNVIYSTRSLDQVVSIAPDFSTLEWRLGGVNATIPATGDAHFSGQHHVTEIAPNRILMFDNGRRRASGLYSRALELAIDVTARTASQAWEFRATPDRLHGVVGGAYRKNNGNTLVTYGFGGGAEINVYEVTATGGVVWHLTAPPAVVRIYKSTPLTSIAGETTVPVP